MGTDVGDPMCAREGCTRYVRSDNRHSPYCFKLCQLVDTELTEAQRVVEATGDTELWTAVVALNDALTQYHLEDYRVLRAARDTGVSPRQYREIKWGHYRA